MVCICMGYRSYKSQYRSEVTFPMQEIEKSYFHIQRVSKPYMKAIGDFVFLSGMLESTKMHDDKLNLDLESAIAVRTVEQCQWDSSKRKYVWSEHHLNHRKNIWNSSLMSEIPDVRVGVYTISSAMFDDVLDDFKPISLTKAQQSLFEKSPYYQHGLRYTKDGVFIKGSNGKRCAIGDVRVTLKSTNVEWISVFGELTTNMTIVPSETSSGKPVQWIHLAKKKRAGISDPKKAINDMKKTAMKRVKSPRWYWILMVPMLILLQLKWAKEDGDEACTFIAFLEPFVFWALHAWGRGSSIKCIFIVVLGVVVSLLGVLLVDDGVYKEKGKLTLSELLGGCFLTCLMLIGCNHRRHR